MNPPATLKAGHKGPQFPYNVIARGLRFRRGLQAPDLPADKQQCRGQLDSIGGPACGDGI